MQESLYKSIFGKGYFTDETHCFSINPDGFCVLKEKLAITVVSWSQKVVKNVLIGLSEGIILYLLIQKNLFTGAFRLMEFVSVYINQVLY